MSGIIKMAKQLQHVTPHKDGGWQVKGGGNDRATVRTDTQGEAIQIARGIAINHGTDVAIHGRNGQIRERNSYGNDPESSKG